MKHIVVHTSKQTIVEELRENKDPNHLDFWPVSNYPKELKPGSRLYLADKQGKLHASFEIKGLGEEKWKGKVKKVLYLEKNTGKIEYGQSTKKASQGGWCYLE